LLPTAFLSFSRILALLLAVNNKKGSATVTLRGVIGLAFAAA
jgi:hypothetical protein